MVSYQPIAVAINAPSCVLNYKSGILSQNECDCSALDYASVRINALFTVVAYGLTTQSDPEYAYCSGFWVLRSSWGTSWGNNGEMKICINRNRDSEVIGTCNVLVYPTFPDLGVMPPMPQ